MNSATLADAARGLPCDAARAVECAARARKSLGMAIVTRGRSFAGFTTEGERVLASARRMLREHELLRRNCEAAPHRPAGSCTLAPCPCACRLRRAWWACCTTCTGHRLHAALHEFVRTGVGPGEHGAGHGHGLPRTPGGHPLLCAWCRSTPSTTFCCAGPARPAHRSAKGPSTTWAEAAALPLCLLTGGCTPAPL